MPYELVVVGGSLGGVRALRNLLLQLPEEFPLPLAAVLHRGPGDSRLSRLLSVSGARPIVEACDRAPLVAGDVLLAPSGYHLLVDRDVQDAGNRRPPLHASLSVEAPVCFARPSIDVLFESAAWVCGDRVIGVLLTGSNRDGADGLARIKECGGLTVVQDPATAEKGDMPAAALAVTEHTVLPLAEIGRFLVSAASDERRGSIASQPGPRGAE